MKKENLAVFMGGDSAEYGISIKSGNIVAKFIDKDLYNVYPIVWKAGQGFYNSVDGEFSLDQNNFSLNLPDGPVTIDRVFIAIHGTPGEDGKLQGLLECKGIPHTSSSSFVSALTFNKTFTNQYLSTNGIKCADSQTFFKGDAIDSEQLARDFGFPMIVKSNASGSSFGVNKVNNIEEIPAAFEDSFLHSEIVLVEKFITGVEVSCGVHNFEGTPKAMAITEIVPKIDFFDFEAKYNGLSDEITPARISEGVYKKVQRLTEKAYHLLQIRGVARADYIIQDGEPYFIEINTVPGLSEASLIPQQAEYEGMSLTTLFNQWIESTKQ